jgi:hypothetical protein
MKKVTTWVIVGIVLCLVALGLAIAFIPRDSTTVTTLPGIESAVPTTAPID